MKPYYEDEFVTLYHGDCLEHPEWWTDADVLVTDPPYGMNYAPRGTYSLRSGIMYEPLGADSVTGDQTTQTRDDALTMWGDKPRIVFGTWKAPRPPKVDHRLIWWKQGQAPGPAKAAWLSQDEEIYVTGKGFIKSSPPNRSVFATKEMRQGQHGETGKIGHPTPKPLPLMEWLLERVPEEWVIADPFAGSGSTLVAAKMLGRRAIGVELEEKYCEITAERLSQGVLPLWGDSSA